MSNADFANCVGVVSQINVRNYNEIYIKNIKLLNKIENYILLNCIWICLNYISYPISGQCSHLIPSEKIRGLTILSCL